MLLLFETIMPLTGLSAVSCLGACAYLVAFGGIAVAASFLFLCDGACWLLALCSIIVFDCYI